MIPNVPAPWPRPRYVSAGSARVAYVVLLPDAVELAQKDNPLFRDFTIEAKYLGDDPAWFDGWINPRSAFGSQLMRTPDLDMVALSKCKAAMVLSAEIEEPADLGYLQRAFLILKLLAQRANAVAACDVESMVWWPKVALEELPDPLEFDVSDHMRVVFEAQEREPGSGHLCHTLGMAKFGRPDLAIGGLDREHAETAGDLLENLARTLAAGDAYETGDIIEQEGFPPLRCVEAQDDSGSDDTTFGNRSIWLVPEEA